MEPLTDPGPPGRPPIRWTPRRLMAVGAIIALIGGALLGAAVMALGTAEPSSSPIGLATPHPSLVGSADPSASPSAPSASTAPSPDPSGPVPSSAPQPTPMLATLPVRASALAIGTDIEMTPTPDGGLYVAVPATSGTVVALLDAEGRLRTGWPIALPRTAACEMPGVAPDGSVRLICLRDFGEPGCVDICFDHLAFAFDAAGRPLPGWPVFFEIGFEIGLDDEAARLVDDELVMVGLDYSAVVEEDDRPQSWLTTVAASGAQRSGVRVSGGDTTISPEGIAYSVSTSWADPAAPVSTISAFGMDGVRDGWPIVVDGQVSEPGFGPGGSIRVTAGWLTDGPVRLLAFDADGRPLPVGSEDLPIGPTIGWNGAGEPPPAAPVVSVDGMTFILGDASVAALDRFGRVMPGWPYRSDVAFTYPGYCPPGSTGCGFRRFTPTVGPGNVLYVLHIPARSDQGGTLVAIRPEGGVRPGWPVALTRAGSELWSVVAAADGTVYALAIEPESGGGASATVLAIEPDSTVRYTTTIVEP